MAKTLMDKARACIACVACGSENVRVVTTRGLDNCIYRRRECRDCKARFSTAEEPVGETTRHGPGGGVVTRSEEMQATVAKFMEAFAEMSKLATKYYTPIDSEAK